MAVTVDTLSSGEISAAAADMPMYVGNNVLDDYAAPAEWRADAGTWASGVDSTDAEYPTFRAYDRKGSFRTRPAYNPASSFYTLLFNLNAGTDGPHTIDTCMIWNHNFASLVGTITVTMQVADDTSFASNLRTLATFTVTSSQRLWSFSLGTSNRYTTVQYARMLIGTNQTNFAGVVPEVGEVFLGRRRQMSFHCDLPWDDKSLESDVIDYRSSAGSVARYVRSAGRRTFDMTMRSSGTDSRFGLNQEVQLRSLWAECDYGGRPFIYCPNPNTNNYPHVVIADPPTLNVPILGPYERQCTMHLVEAAPYVQTELSTYPH